MDGSKQLHTTTRTGAQWLLQALEAEGCEVLFGYPGGAIMPVYDALVDSPIKHILVRHEQGAALAADGYARASGKVGVLMTGSYIVNLRRIAGYAKGRIFFSTDENDFVPIGENYRETFAAYTEKAYNTL